MGTPAIIGLSAENWDSPDLAWNQDSFDNDQQNKENVQG